MSGGLFDRTGWEVWERGTFNEVLPQDDLKEHGLGDECICNPIAEDVTGVPEGGVKVLITHNSFDKRELSEPGYRHRNRNKS